MHVEKHDVTHVSLSTAYDGVLAGSDADDAVLITERLETFARRAVKGEWEQSGSETFARRRGGVTPETPVREVETPKKSS